MRPHDDFLEEVTTAIRHERAARLAAETGKDPRLAELILEQSTEVARKAAVVLITRNRLGLACANAGIDQSNVDHRRYATALLLPTAPGRPRRAAAPRASRPAPASGSAC